jgi:spore maturation protein CgeB
MNLNIVVIGLSVTSSWGNGHATTYRALLGALAQRGHTVTFLERDVPWYREHRDLENPSGWSVRLYNSLADLPRQFSDLVATANLVIVGSYVPDGISIAEWVTSQAQGITAFYDIDTPVTLAGIESGLDYIAPRLIPRFDLYLSFSGGPVPAMLEDTYGSPMARVLYCSADLCAYRPHTAAPKWSLGYLGTYSEDRQPNLEQLLIAPAHQLGDERFVVAGSKYPAELNWPDNVERIEHLAGESHAAFYSAQRFALNVTRADMRMLGFSPSVRLFEAAACGTPIISDRWPGLETLFAPSEILLADGPRDVIQILTAMSEDTRLSIAEQARRRVRNDHTPDHRARQLESYFLEVATQQGRASKRRPVADKILTAGI